MSRSFAELVEEIKGLSIQEKQELQHLLERYLLEERREEVYESYMDSLAELENGKAEFSSDTDKLKGMLLND